MPEIKEFADALLDAPSDMAPRLILQDWLDEQAMSYRHETEAADWRWYWQELIPAFRERLTKPRRADSDPWARMGDYLPRRKFERVKPGIQGYWCSALLRVMPFPDGSLFWDRIDHAFQRNIAILESRLLFPESWTYARWTDLNNTDTFGVHLELLDPYNTVIHSNIVDLPHTPVNSCVYWAQPNTYSNIKPLLDGIRDALAIWTTNIYISPESSKKPAKIIHDQAYLYPLFLADTMDIVVAQDRKRNPHLYSKRIPNGV